MAAPAMGHDNDGNDDRGRRARSHRPGRVLTAHHTNRTHRTNSDIYRCYERKESTPERGCAQAVNEYVALMPTYIYETTDPTKPIRNFEVKQSVHDDPLQSDPETGEAVRRVISAGYSILLRGKSIGPSVGSVGSH